MEDRSDGPQGASSPPDCRGPSKVGSPPGRPDMARPRGRVPLPRGGPIGRPARRPSGSPGPPGCPASAIVGPARPRPISTAEARGPSCPAGPFDASRREISARATGSPEEADGPARAEVPGVGGTRSRRPPARGLRATRGSGGRAACGGSAAAATAGPASGPAASPTGPGRSAPAAAGPAVPCGDWRGAGPGVVPGRDGLPPRRRAEQLAVQPLPRRSGEQRGQRRSQRPPPIGGAAPVRQAFGRTGPRDPARPGPGREGSRLCPRVLHSQGDDRPDQDGDEATRLLPNSTNSCGTPARRRRVGPGGDRVPRPTGRPGCTKPARGGPFADRQGASCRARLSRANAGGDDTSEHSGVLPRDYVGRDAQLPKLDVRDSNQSSTSTYGEPQSWLHRYSTSPPARVTRQWPNDVPGPRSGGPGTSVFQGVNSGFTSPPSERPPRLAGAIPASTPAHDGHPGGHHGQGQDVGVRGRVAMDSTARAT